MIKQLTINNDHVIVLHNPYKFPEESSQEIVNGITLIESNIRNILKVSISDSRFIDLLLETMIDAGINLYPYRNSEDFDYKIFDKQYWHFKYEVEDVVGAKKILLNKFVMLSIDAEIGRNANDIYECLYYIKDDLRSVPNYRKTWVLGFKPITI